MSVRMRHTSSHTKNRRSHHSLTAASIVTDKDSGALRLPHRLDETTGMYRGKQIIPKKVMTAKAEKSKTKAQHKKEHIHEHAEGYKEPVIVSAKDESDKSAKGLMGRMTLGKAKSRSGFGGGA